MALGEAGGIVALTNSLASSCCQLCAKRAISEQTDDRSGQRRRIIRWNQEASIAVSDDLFEPLDCGRDKRRAGGQRFDSSQAKRLFA